MGYSVEDLELEGSNEPMELTMRDGEVFHFLNPIDIPFDILMHFEEKSPEEVIRAVLGGDFDRFIAHPESNARVLNGVAKQYIKHFGLLPPGEGGASPRSSTRTARRSK